VSLRLAFAYRSDIWGALTSAGGARWAAMTSYTFGTSPTAADRLLVVARVFDPTMAAVLAELPRRRWRRVLDLGCGPGSSTERLARHLDAGELIGLDASADFCAAARDRVPHALFVVGDVLAPFPVRSPDIVYARYVLSHLPDPLRVARGWAAQLAPDGWCVLEEPDRIETDDDVFTRYLALTGGLVASRGADMYVGRTLASLDAPVNRVFELAVSAADAATMFSLNLASLRAEPWVTARRSEAELDELTDVLTARASGETTGPDVGWRVRQVVLEAA
jgi:trans-aconitate 2-methyltransferase